jgi:hypothetical protein
MRFFCKQVQIDRLAGSRHASNFHRSKALWRCSRYQKSKAAEKIRATTFKFHFDGIFTAKICFAIEARKF